MSDTINWRELSANQRDALVAQHIFGRDVVQWRPDRDLLMKRQCAEGHEAIPPYTASLDALWLIMDHVRPGSRDEKQYEHGDFLRLATFVDELCNMDGWWSWPRERLCDTVCLAVLKAHGVEVVLDEEKPEDCTVSSGDILNTTGPVITGCVFGSLPWYTKLRLPRRIQQWLQRRTEIALRLMWHSETKDHIAVVNGVPLRVPHINSEYPCFMDLNFRTAKNAYRLYQRVKVDLSEYRTMATYDVCKEER